MGTERKPPQSAGSQDLRFIVETELENDSRWIAEIPQVPGALAYGTTKEEAINKAYAIALRQWSSAKARIVYKALLRNGWTFLQMVFPKKTTPGNGALTIRYFRRIFAMY